MATVISELIISYLVEELTLESITTPVKQTISIKGTQEMILLMRVHDLLINMQGRKQSCKDIQLGSESINY